MADVYKGLTIQFGADTQPLTKALREIDKGARTINKELRKVDNALKFNPGNTELLRQKQQQLSKQIEQTRDRLEKLREAESKLGEDDIGTEAYDNLQREIIETESKLSTLERKLEDTKNVGKKSAQEIADQWKAAGEKIKKVGDSVSGVGKKLSIGLTAPIVAGVGLLLNESIKFESAFAGVRKTVEGTDEQLAKIEQGVRDMAKALPSSREEIAKVAESAGQLGIETDNVLGFTRVMIDLGESTNLSAEEAATGLARLANITGMQQDKFDNLGSTVVALGNNFATTEAEIVNMGLRLAGAGKQIGLTEAQIMGIAAALSSVGIDAEAGGSAVSKTLINMATAVETNSAQLKTWAETAGMSVAEFKTLFEQDAASAFEAVVIGLGNMEEKGGSALLQLEALGISEVRQRDALLRLAGSQDILTSALDMSTAAWNENTALSKEAGERYKTLESKLGILKNKATDVALTVGDALAPALGDAIEAAEPLINKISDLAEKFSEADPSTQKLIMTIAGIAAVAGPALLIIGQLISAVGSIVGVISALIVPVTTFFSLLSGGAGIVGALTAMFPLLGTAITVLTGPIGIAIAAIAAIIAILVLLWKKNDKFREAVTKAWEAIKDAVGRAIEWFKTEPPRVFEEIASFFTGIWEKIIVGVTWAWDMFVAIIRSAWSLVTAIFMLNPLVALIAHFWPEIIAGAQAAWEIIKSVISVAWDAIKTVTSAVWGAIRKAIDVVWGVIVAIFRRSPLGIIIAHWDQIKAKTAAIWNATVGVVTGAWDKLSSTASRVFGAIKSAIEVPIKAAVEFVADKLDGLKSMFEKLKLKLPHIPMPHFKVNGEFSLKPPKVPTFSVDWYASGGSFPAGTPAIIGVGDQRRGYEHVLRDDQIVRLMKAALAETGGGGFNVTFTGEMPQNYSQLIRGMRDIKEGLWR